MKLKSVQIPFLPQNDMFFFYHCQSSWQQITALNDSFFTFNLVNERRLEMKPEKQP